MPWFVHHPNISMLFKLINYGPRRVLLSSSPAHEAKASLLYGNLTWKCVLVYMRDWTKPLRGRLKVPFLQAMVLLKLEQGESLGLIVGGVCSGLLLALNIKRSIDTGRNCSLSRLMPLLPFASSLEESESPMDVQGDMSSSGYLPHTSKKRRATWMTMFSY